MKVLVVHNFHRTGSASGDDQVFKAEEKLLGDAGCEVVDYSVCNDEFDKAGLLGKLKTALGMLWSFKHYRRLKSVIKENKPDIVHFHTFFPLLSPSVLYAAKRSGCKVVATCHDTRFICPCATSLRDGKLCNECGDGHYMRMAGYGCFKQSKMQSLIVAFIFKYHRLRKSFYRQIDKYICLNDNQINLLKSIGFDEGKIVKKYNFVEDNSENTVVASRTDIPERYVVFYGRIGEEKGIRNLMKIWDEISDIPLVVMGGGPLEEEFGFWADSKDNVFFLGYTKHAECLGIVKNAEFVVFPSIWYEGCSMVEIESESLGKPIIANNLGFSAEAIKNDYNGVLVELGNNKAFVDAVRSLWKEPEKIAAMGENARKDYVDKYRSCDNLKQLLNIYESLIN